MSISDACRRGVAAMLLWLALAPAARGQAPPDPLVVHDHAGHDAHGTLFPPHEGSGTAWAPDETPHHAVHRTIGAWDVMLHGAFYLQYLREAAPEHRGSDQVGSINWAMAMARRPAGGGRAGVRAMFSLEPWTIGGCGYPDLLATGEICDGDTIHDLQHPHDLVMELAGDFDRPLTSTTRWQVYGGLAGEPALGPVSFPHRFSAAANPIAPIGHHWLDATHIVFGVATAGVSGARWKVEASLFNGREPDERRHTIDLAPLDSFSGRVSWRPTSRLALQVSAGRLHEAEPPHGSRPRLDVDRITASASYHRAVGSRVLLAGTAAWGRNTEAGRSTHAALVEASVSVADRDVWFGRVEAVEKPAHDLHVHESTGVFTVGKAQGGYVRYLPPAMGLRPGLGGTLSAGIVPPALRERYGGVGVGVGVFLTVRPARSE